MTRPPEDTHALFRGRCLAKFPEAVVAAGWDALIFDTGSSSLQRVPMLERGRGTRPPSAACSTAWMTLPNFWRRSEANRWAYTRAVTMNPALWTKSPMTVHQEFVSRHGDDAMPPTFMWAVWAAEGSDHLKELDDRYPGPQGVDVIPHPDLVDISHVRWATANAITAIDLCAATLGRMFCGGGGAPEFTLPYFDPQGPPKFQPAVANRRDALTPTFLRWVDDTLRDVRYVNLRSARNPFTHSWLQRRLSRTMGAVVPPHTDRTEFSVPETGYEANARDIVVTSAELALDRVADFVTRMDNH